MYHTGFRFYERVFQSECLQVQSNGERAKAQAKGKKERLKKVHEARGEKKFDEKMEKKVARQAKWGAESGARSMRLEGVTMTGIEGDSKKERRGR